MTTGLPLAPVPVTVRAEDAMVAGEIHLRLRHQAPQSSDAVYRLEEHAWATRTLRRDDPSARHCRLDLAAAIVSLIGHTGASLTAASEQPVDQVQGTPELEVIREGAGYVLRIPPNPALKRDAS